MPIDLELQKVIDEMLAAGLSSLYENATPEEARERGRRARKDFYPPVLQKVSSITQGCVVTPDHDIPIRTYWPLNAVEGSMPTVVYFHGGAWIIGDLDSHDGHARRICSTLGAVVVNVDYRLAPEDPFPAGYDDCVVVTSWVFEHIGDLGGDLKKVAVAGDSAGGNLAAAVAFSFKNAPHRLAGQLLIYPGVDLAGTGNQLDAEADTTLTGKPGDTYIRDQYLSDPSLAFDPRVSPLRATSHADLAPAVIGVAEFDVLRAEGVAYAKALQKAGVYVTLREFDGLIHGFFGMGGVSAAAEAAADLLTRDLGAIFQVGND